MYLTFASPNKATVEYEINLADNVDAYGNADPQDFSRGYEEDLMYFKAGAYNQCSTKDGDSIWYANCPGAGVWATDQANGDYVNVTFSALTIGRPTPPTTHCN